MLRLIGEEIEGKSYKLVDCIVRSGFSDWIEVGSGFFVFFYFRRSSYWFYIRDLRVLVSGVLRERWRVF